jgi:AraC-like DNA-binding protein
VLYQQVPPSPPLAGLVERLWFLEGDADEIAAEPIPPDAHAEIIVHAGEPFGELAADGTLRPQQRVLFAGQLTRAVRVLPRGFSRMAGARLRPHGAYALFGVPQRPFTDRIVPLRDIDAALAATLAAEVVPAAADALVPALDRVLAPLSARAAEREVAVAPAVDLALDRRGLVRVADLAERAALSPRQLERRFQEQVGLAPKLFLRILRFQEVLNAIRPPTDAQGGDVDATRWADVAVAHGFYDQAHFIRDFKGFVGESPAAWHVSDASLAAIFSAIRRGPVAPGPTGSRPAARTRSAGPPTARKG